MRVNGIIAEYNPFHNGHLYQLQTSKTENNADYTIVVMSGNYVQRGEPAIFDKFTRSYTALQNGADLVLELPGFYSTSSAEYFARGGITMLDKLGVVNTLSFGSECGDLNILSLIAQILLEEPEEYSAILKESLQKGMTFPAARNNALLRYCPSLESQARVFTSPNNILGIEYLKCLISRNSKIRATTIKRIGGDYHDRYVTDSYCSAMAIRQAVFNGSTLHSLSQQIPKNTIPVLSDYVDQYLPINGNHFSQMLFYKMLSESDKGFTQYADVSEELSNRICRQLFAYTNFYDFCNILKTKNMTYTRISRCLLHILLDITTQEGNTYSLLGDIPYARVLGFKRNAAPLLDAVMQNSEIPLITKLSDAKSKLPKESYDLFLLEMRRSNLYRGIQSLLSNKPLQNEHQIPLVIL